MAEEGGGRRTEEKKVGRMKESAGGGRTNRWKMSGEQEVDVGEEEEQS